MNKKKYQKPEMQVYPLSNTTPLLGGSPYVYIHRMDQDMNQITHGDRNPV